MDYEEKQKRLDKKPNEFLKIEEKILHMSSLSPDDFSIYVQD